MTALLATVLVVVAPQTAPADPLANFPDHASWRTAATDRLYERDGDADRGYWHFALTIEDGILFFDQREPGSGPGPGTGEHIARVYVREASCLLGGRLGGDGPWICAPAGWFIEAAGLTPVPPAVEWCESKGRNDAYNPESEAAGPLQMLPGTFASVGGRGDPRDASYAENMWRGALLWNHGAGASHWAECL